MTEIVTAVYEKVCYVRCSRSNCRKTSGSDSKSCQKSQWRTGERAIRVLVKAGLMRPRERGTPLNPWIHPPSSLS